MVNYAPRKKTRKIQRNTQSPQQSGGDSTHTSLNPDLLTEENILQLQRQFGNQYVTNLINRQVATNSNSSISFPKIQRTPDGTIQRLGGNNGYEPLGDEEDDYEDTDFSSTDTVEDDVEDDNEDEVEENSTNPFLSDIKIEKNDEELDDFNPFEDTEETDPTDVFKDWDSNMDDSFDQKKGVNPNNKVDKHGYSGTFGKIKDGGKGSYQTVKTGVNTKKFVKGIKEQLSGDKKINENTQKGLFSRLKNAIAKIIEAIEKSKVAGASVFEAAINAIGTVKDVLDEIVKYGVPIVSTVVSIVSGAYSVYTGWTTYKAFDIAGKEATELLEANEDDTDDLEAPLLKDKSTKKSSQYAAAKTWRAFLSKIFSFGTSLGKGLSQIAALFTGGLAGVASVGFSLIQSAKTGVDWLKALYKIGKGTKGQNRTMHSNIIMESADQGNKQALKLLLDLGLTGDMWMLKLAAKMGVEYDPTYKDYSEVLGSKWLGDQKNKVMKFGSKKANQGGDIAKEYGDDWKQYTGKVPTWLSKKINSQFIQTDKETALALMIEPRDIDELHVYLQNLKKVGMYNDFGKELAGKMKSK